LTGFLRYKIYNKFVKKGLGFILGVFSQTHLVTLPDAAFVLTPRTRERETERERKKIGQKRLKMEIKILTLENNEKTTFTREYFFDAI
jgi:hypothetical protein